MESESPITTTPIFGFESTAMDVVKGRDLTGYEVIVTGGASGLGIETVRALSSVGAKCTIATRDLTKAQTVADELNKELAIASIQAELLDLSSLKSIGAFVERWSNRPLNILIANAGVLACPLEHTEDGFERQIGTNHYGHFALFQGLVPSLVAGAKQLGKSSRVVVLSSMIHARSPIHFDDIHYKSRPYDKMDAYAQSKTANALFAMEVSRLYADEGIYAYAVHPGVIKTNIGRHLTDDDRKKSNFAKCTYKNIEQGASTQVWAACAPELENKAGLYLNDTQIATKVDEPETIYATAAGYVQHAVDPDTATKLWERTGEEIKAAIAANSSYCSVL